MSICTYCSKEGRIAARGLCGTCYARWQRNGTAEHIKKPDPVVVVSQCSYCHTAEGPFVKTFCRACYQRQYHNGTPERQRTIQLCEYPGCDEPVKSKGFCQKHYMRLRRRGTAVPNSPEDHGGRRKHPLYERWRSMRRGAGNRVVPEWQDFGCFAADVGDCPSANHRLRLIDPNGLYGPHNIEWREIIALKDPSNRESRNAYMREYFRQRPSNTKRSYLKRHYKITLEWYEEKLREQNHLCQICGKPETVTDKKTGELYLLAVDHNGETGAVRGLLCMGCNTGIGGLKHSVDNLRAAIAYLERHAEPH